MAALLDAHLHKFYIYNPSDYQLIHVAMLANSKGTDIISNFFLLVWTRGPLVTRDA